MTNVTVFVWDSCKAQSFCVTEIKTIVLEKASTISTVNFLSFQDGQKNDFQLLFYPVRFGIFKLTKFQTNDNANPILAKKGGMGSV
jgi:hypothetical protein